MAKTALVMLTELSEFFYTASEPEARKAWDVLTALRGPDEDGGHLADARKEASTAVLRAKFFSLYSSERDTFASMPLSLARRKLGCIIRTDTQGDAALRDDSLTWYGHFGNHARNGFKALGLNWSATNKF